MNGEYKEKLPFGHGELIVTKDKYYIQFYFSGPDLRYSGTFITLGKSEISRYIKAYENNWKRYLELKQMKYKLGSEFSLTGELGMKINVGGSFDGVCIKSYHLPINSEKDIKRIINSFNLAEEKGREVMVFLNQLK